MIKEELLNTIKEIVDEIVPNTVSSIKNKQNNSKIGITRKNKEESKKKKRIAKLSRRKNKK